MKKKELQRFYNENADKEFEKQQGPFPELEKFRLEFSQGVCLPTENPKNKKILDLGCGTGRDFLFFEKYGFDVTGVDFSIECLNHLANARVEENKNLYCVSYKDFFKYNKEKFDGIWCCASLVFLSKNELKEIYTKLKEILNDNGRLYFSLKETGEISLGDIIEMVWNDNHNTRVTDDPLGRKWYNVFIRK